MQNDVENFVKSILNELKDYIVDYREFSGQEPEYSNFSFKNKEINEFLEKINFKLYKHQVIALEKLYSGKNIVVTTPTASGKSEIFRLFILDSYLQNMFSTFLLIYPTRALLYDQYEKFKEKLKGFEEFLGQKLNIKLAYLLGDMSFKEKNQVAKQNPNILFTTIDNLHLFMLKNHDKFHFFFKNLKLIVIDEVHVCRGVFGTNAAYVMRRLIRLLNHFYNNKGYRIVALSATLENSKEFVERLLGIPGFEEIKESFHRKQKKYIFLIDSKNLNSKVILKKIINLLLENNIKSLIFLESKKGVELTKLSLIDLDDNEKIHPYKASLLREDRRRIEREFKKGKYQILITTSALELGIDIGDVTCVVNYGVPADGMFSIIQRFGRGGRISKGINILILKKDALDFYYKTHKDDFFNKLEKNKIDKIPVNLDNKSVIKKHLIYLINEFGRLNINILSDIEKFILYKLVEEGKVKISKNPLTNEIYCYLISQNIKYTSLRNISDDIFYLVKWSPDVEKIINRLKYEKSAYKIANMLKSKKIIIEEIDKYAFYNYLLPGMVYYSLGNLYKVTNIRKIGKVHFVLAKKISIREMIETYPLYTEDVRITNIYDKKQFKDLEIYFGKIEVNRSYIGYIEKYKAYEYNEHRHNFYEDPIEYSFVTKGIWIVLPEQYREIESIYRKVFENKLKKVLKKINKQNLFDYIKDIASSIDKEYLYNKYRGDTSKKIYEILEKYISRLGINKEKKKILFFAKKLVDSNYCFRGGLHAIEHNIIKISPLITNIDPKELGGYSYEFYSSYKFSEESYEFVGKPIIFIYEGYENGVGLTEMLFENFRSLLKKSYEILFTCKCLDGCPRCIYSTKCGNFNEFLDKYAARFIYSKIF